MPPFGISPDVWLFVGVVLIVAFAYKASVRIERAFEQEMTRKFGEPLPSRDFQIKGNDSEALADRERSGVVG